MKTALAAVAGIIGAIFSFRWFREAFAAGSGGSASSSGSPIYTDPIAFRAAKYFRKTPEGTKRIVRWIVIHDAECNEGPRAAEGVGAYFANPFRPQKNADGSVTNVPVQASAHYSVDSDSVVQSVKDNDVAFAAPPLNDNGLHFELTGFAKQTAAEWDDAESRAMLQRCARLVADRCREHGIPITDLVPAEKLPPIGELATASGGITTHAAISKAYKKSDHQDPGKNFPGEAFIAMVRTASS